VKQVGFKPREGVTDEQRGVTKEEEVHDRWRSIEASRKWRNWYENEVDDEMKGVDEDDTVTDTVLQRDTNLLT